MSYRKALEILKALPPEKQRLARGEYCDEAGDCCALGALTPALQDLPSDQNNDEIANLIEKDAIVDAFVDLDLSLWEAFMLQNYNDSTYGAPEQRYQKVVEWLEAYVAKEALG